MTEPPIAPYPTSKKKNCNLISSSSLFFLETQERQIGRTGGEDEGI